MMSALAVPADSRDIGASPRWWSLTQRLLGSLVLITLLPLFAILYVLVRSTSRGPFLFTQERTGRGGRRFRVYKIRTLAVGSEGSTKLGVKSSASQITPVGRVLRELKLDELPQLFNVARGDMELVGPRPIPLALEARLRESIPSFDRRFLVKPGLTNIAQIAVLDNRVQPDSLIEDWKRRFRAEQLTIAHKSVSHDLVLVALTIIYCLRKTRRVVRRRLFRAAERAPTESAEIQTPEKGALPSAVKVMGVWVHCLTRSEWRDRLIDLVTRREAGYGTFCPVHSLSDAQDVPEHRQALRQASLVGADGMPVVWAQRWFGKRRSERVYGPDCMLDALQLAEARGWRVGLLGGRPDVLRTLTHKLEERFPALELSFVLSPPFRPLTEQETAFLCSDIRASRLDLLLIGLGSPKQEIWMNKNAHRVRAFMLGVGAAFDFHAGSVRQAPVWMRRAGLEWAFRLACEPRRLFRRYLRSNPRFLAWFLRASLSGRRGVTSLSQPLRDIAA
ncbi:MAG: WecB/TagA/CpsF family glycosyltransferase [Planctomycetota bacterium]|jgi:N-acetylglucosaminyldiphosphoundecaprenol N-acetyl-beta-D-mannosaminyltransferase